jgi:hypothetical protein
MKNTNPGHRHSRCTLGNSLITLKEAIYIERRISFYRNDIGSGKESSQLVPVSLFPKNLNGWFIANCR